MNSKIAMTLACLALVAWVGSAEAGDSMSKPSNATSVNPSLAANTNQCDPACVAPEICCRLSGTESACVDPKDCFASDDNSKLKRK